MGVERFGEVGGVALVMESFVSWDRFFSNWGSKLSLKYQHLETAALKDPTVTLNPSSC